MRRFERQITDRAEIDAVLYAAPWLDLAMIDGEEPYVVPMHFGYDGTAIYLHSARAGRKVDVLRRAPRVGFTALVGGAVEVRAHACKSFTRYRSVIGAGRVRILDAREERLRALDCTMRKYTDQPYTYHEGVLAVTLVMRLEIDWITGKHGGHPGEGDGVTR